MNSKIQLQIFVYQLLKSELPSLEINELEKLGIETFFYSLFEGSDGLDEIISQIYDYCEENEKFLSLNEKIQQFYSYSLKV